MLLFRDYMHVNNRSKKGSRRVKLAWRPRLSPLTTLASSRCFKLKAHERIKQSLLPTTSRQETPPARLPETISRGQFHLQLIKRKLSAIFSHMLEFILLWRRKKHANIKVEHPICYLFSCRSLFSGMCSRSSCLKHRKEWSIITLKEALVEKLWNDCRTNEKEWRHKNCCLSGDGRQWC